VHTLSGTFHRVFRRFTNSLDRLRLFTIVSNSVIGDLVVVRRTRDAAGRRGGVGRPPASDGRVTRVAESTRRLTGDRRGASRNRCSVVCPRTVLTLSRARPRALSTGCRDNSSRQHSNCDRTCAREMEALGGLTVAAQDIRALSTARADRACAGDSAPDGRREPASRVVREAAAPPRFRGAERRALPVRQSWPSLRSRHARLALPVHRKTHFVRLPSPGSLRSPGHQESKLS